MPKVSYGTRHEPTFDLKNSDELMVVRTRSRRSLRSGPVQPLAAAEVGDGQLVFSLPEAGVEVYRVPTAPGARTIDERKAALRKQPDIEFAGGVLVDDAGEPVLYTENLFVKFVDNADADECKKAIEDAGLKIKRPLEYATNAFFVEAPERTGQKVFDIAQELMARDDIEYSHPELVRRKAHRTLAAEQWHLRATSINDVAVDAHANVQAAHQLTLGQGITIAIIDDGIDIDHPEFSSDFKIVAPRDATFPVDHPQGTDPRPKDPDPMSPDNHGTACAGVACANGTHGASGVAPLSRLLPIRLAAGLGSQQEADAFTWAADHGADVISCSWGPPDGKWWDPNDPRHLRHVPLAPSTRLAINYAITNGRGGKGCVILFAAGNGNESVDNDGYASYEKVVAVAACNDRGKRSVYSDFGRAVWCAFPSSDFEWPEKNHPPPLTPGIWTTDRMSRLGYNPGQLADGDLEGNYTNTFGGTSSACPGAAGVAALVLSANPTLTWLEAKEVLRKACDRIDLEGGEYDANSHSRFYGFGRLNAEKAVKLAKQTSTAAFALTKTFNRCLPDLKTTEVTLDISDGSVVKDFAVHVELQHTFIGDLVITLIPPASKGLPKVVLHNRQGGATHDLRRTFDVSNAPELARYRNTSCNGKWTLQIADMAAEDAGVLVSFGVDLKFGDGAIES